jgi:hypothetical protein
MTERHESRFFVQSPAKVTLQTSPEVISECILTDISATGIGLITRDSLPVDGIILVETEQHLLLAKIRHCDSRGDGFSVGAERIQAVSKLAEAGEGHQDEQRRMLIQQFQTGTTAEDLKPPRVQPPIETSCPVEPAVEATIDPLAKLRAAAQQDVEPSRSRTSAKTKRISLGFAATAIATLLVFGLHQNGAKPNHSPASIAPEQNHQSDPAASAAITPGAPKPRHAVVIKADESSWLSVNSDGKQIFERVLAADQSLDVDFSQEAELRIGNAGGVAISLDGKSLGELGEHGQFRIVRLDPDGFRLMPRRN